MKANPRTTTVGSLAKQMMKPDSFNFNHPIQRGEEQWSNDQKTKLVDSFFRGYILDSPRVIVSMVDKNGDLILDEETGKPKRYNIVIDGKQRMTTIRDFYLDKFKLSKCLMGMPSPFPMDSEALLMNSLVGKKYSELDEYFRDKLDDVNITIYYLEEVSEWDLKEMFKRQNGGKALTKAQMNGVKMSAEVFLDVKRVLDADGYIETYEKPTKKEPDRKTCKDYGNLWKRFLGSGTIKNGGDRNIALASMMFISGYKFNEQTKKFEFNLLNEDIEEFLAWFGEKSAEERTEIANKTIKAAHSINSRIKRKVRNETGVYEAVKQPIIKKTSMPMLVAGMAKVEEQKGSKSLYMERVLAFFEGYDDNLEYKELVDSGSAEMEKVNARWRVFDEFTKR